MNLINKKVAHNSFGEGVITNVTDKYVTVEFEKEVKTFQYPICFDLFLKILDHDLNGKVAEQIEVLKEGMEEERIKLEVKRLDDENQLMLNHPSKRIINKAKKQTMDLLSIHSQCFDYLMNYRKTQENFNFLPRQTNNKNRLDEGYYFIGNSKYLLITFWKGIDSLEKIYNINFGIEQTGQCYIELSARDNPEKAKYFSKLAQVLEDKLHVPYNEVKIGKLRRNYPMKVSYLEALDSFILNEKEIIDDFIKMHSGLGMKFIDNETFNKAVQKIIIAKAEASTKPVVM